MNELSAVLRTENKYLLTQMQYFSLKDKLAQIVSADPHNGLSGYRVRSLYFDTAKDSDFFDKLDGVEDRRKLRLRIYRPNAEDAKLELKEKSGIYQYKRSLRVSAEQARRLATGDFTPLRDFDHPFALELRNLVACRVYRPRCIVEYQRFALIHPANHFRTTFDLNVRAGLVPQNFFDQNPALCPVLPFGNVLMEVKFNRFLLSIVKNLISTCDCSPVAVSKYCMARMVGV